MNPNEFYSKLSELAELKQTKVPKTPARREADDPDEVWREGRVIHLTKDNNPTLNWEIKKIKHQTRLCEDCGELVNNRIVELKICEYPKPHWRERCANCKMSRNPDTGQFDLTSTEASNTYRELLTKNPQFSTLRFKKPTK